MTSGILPAYAVALIALAFALVVVAVFLIICLAPVYRNPKLLAPAPRPAPVNDHKSSPRFDFVALPHRFGLSPPPSVLPSPPPAYLSQPSSPVPPEYASPVTSPVSSSGHTAYFSAHGSPQQVLEQHAPSPPGSPSEDSRRLEAQNLGWLSPKNGLGTSGLGLVPSLWKRSSMQGSSNYPRRM
ncbi:hypothetical protein CYLTODRAFT_493271 [Cylindrobasidium torrendii FP15055 ss-10]|uniref:Transmembrane protein n=1 Tax=Cylindrobasidium torrendii FP15055 ss-10 TaxID=1314674 RepID=A0A0D7B412_9AGAR|nr:hypothetical protein CYLTODRAFT_493271 [Cylindrobasidium torrendii FP15055 ss-10]